ncbi:MAG: LysR family transcriptional regulator [Myxococcaceae bacterium]
MDSEFPMMDTAHLQAFGVFARTLNFTATAKALSLSQPAVFERIQLLGARLGRSLYRREGRALVLTADGERVARFARELEDRWREFSGELSGVVEPEVVRLAAGEGSYLFVLGPALSTFRRESKARLDLLTLGAKDTLGAVQRGEAHLGVAVIDLVPRGLEAEPLLTTPLCAALPARHPLASKRTLTLADLRGERWVVTPDGQTHRELLTRALGQQGAVVDAPLEADGWPLMLKFVELGLGVAVVNGVCAKTPGVALRPLAELGHVTYRLVTRRGARRPPQADRLAELLRRSGR